VVQDEPEDEACGVAQRVREEVAAADPQRRDDDRVAQRRIG
jgi:hypothetical protein